jgi:hypothetical protein
VETAEGKSTDWWESKMPAYTRGEASLESYLVKIIAALCRQAGGEIRIRGDQIDVIDQPVTLLKDWDSKTQELVLRTHLGSFCEVFRAIPEKQPTKEVIAADPIRRQQEEIPLVLPLRQVGSTLDDAKLTEMERKLTKRRVAALITDEMKRRNQPEA